MRNRPTPAIPMRPIEPAPYTPPARPTVVPSTGPAAEPPASNTGAVPAGSAPKGSGGRARRLAGERAPHDGWTFVLIPPGTGATPWTMRISVRRLRVVFGTLVALATATLSVGVLLAVLISMAPEIESETAGVQLGVFESDAPAVSPLPADILAPAMEVASALGASAAPMSAPRVARKAPAPVKSTRTTPVRTERRAAARPPARNSLADVDQGLLASLPVLGRITSQWSNARRHPVLGVVRRHQGVDIAAPTGTRITAPAAGTVRFAGSKVGFGRTVEIDHGNGVVTRYAHCRTLKVQKGEHVTPGQLIATVGSTGLAKGPHLHYEVLVNGKSVDPLRTPLSSLLSAGPSREEPAATTVSAPGAAAGAAAPAAPVAPPVDDAAQATQATQAAQKSELQTSR
jgi:hypothetical protein